MGSTSATLLGRLRDLGDPQAWREFEARYKPRILAWCRTKGLQPADADDVTQDVLLRVAKRMPTFVYEGNFSGWLRVVWRNAWIDSVKDTTPGGKGSGDTSIRERLENVGGDDFAEYLRKELESEVMDEALARTRPRVSARDWQIFNAIVFGDKSGTEMAKTHHLSLARVSLIKTSVQKKLSEEITKLEGTDEEKRTDQP